MRRSISYFVALTIFAVSATTGFAQTSPTPSRDEAEKNAFQTPTTGHAGAKSNSPAATTGNSQHSGSNPEAKNIDEPQGNPTKASPNGTAK